MEFDNKDNNWGIFSDYIKKQPKNQKVVDAINSLHFWNQIVNKLKTSNFSEDMKKNEDLLKFYIMSEEEKRKRQNNP